MNVCNGKEGSGVLGGSIDAGYWGMGYGMSSRSDVVYIEIGLLLWPKMGKCVCFLFLFLVLFVE